MAKTDYAGQQFKFEGKNIKKNKMKRTTLLLLLITMCLSAVIQQSAIAQEIKATTKDFKNTTHINITNPIIFGVKSFIFGYERVINKHQTISVNVGKVGFPSLGSNLSVADREKLFEKLNAALADKFPG